MMFLILILIPIGFLLEWLNDLMDKFHHASVCISERSISNTLENAEENGQKLLIQPIRIIGIPREQHQENVDFSELPPSYENVMTQTKY